MPVYFDTHTHQSYSLISQSNSFALLVTDRVDDLSKLNFYSSDNLLYAMGFHPCYLPSDLSSLDLLENKIMLGNVDAIGEIGLDFFPEFIDNKLKQLKYFNLQLDLAYKYDLPVSIHARKSLNEVFSCIKNSNNFGVIHGFNGSYEQAIEFVKKGFKIGVNGVVCNPKAVRYHKLVTKLPLSKIVLETDFPYVKNRSLRPILIDEVATMVAKLKKISAEEVVRVTTNTAKRIFLRKSC